MPKIYHIASHSDWSTQQNASEFTAESLESEGFIHASNADQIVDTANLIFSGRDDLLILTIDPDQLTSPVKEEDLYGHGAHPHIYGPINRPAILSSTDFPCSPDGTFSLPELLP